MVSALLNQVDHSRFEHTFEGGILIEVILGIDFFTDEFQFENVFLLNYIQFHVIILKIRLWRKSVEASNRSIKAGDFFVFLGRRLVRCSFFA